MFHYYMTTTTKRKQKQSSLRGSTLQKCIELESNLLKFLLGKPKCLAIYSHVTKK